MTDNTDTSAELASLQGTYERQYRHLCLTMGPHEAEQRMRLSRTYRRLHELEQQRDQATAPQEEVLTWDSDWIDRLQEGDLSVGPSIYEEEGYDVEVWRDGDWTFLRHTLRPRPGKAEQLFRIDDVTFWRPRQ